MKAAGLVCGASMLVAAVVLLTGSAVGSAPERAGLSVLGVAAGAGTSSSLASAPRGLQEAVSRTLGRSLGGSGYEMAKGKVGLLARTGSISARFGDSGPVVSVGGSRVGFTFEGVGEGGALVVPRRSAPVASGGRVVYARGDGVTEWYRNGAVGIEQGFTLEHRPSVGDHGGELVITLAVSGSLRPRVVGRSIAFGGASRPLEPVLRYGRLSVSDAAGRVLPSSLSLVGRMVRLVIDSAGASYPLRVDPLIQQGAKLAPAAGEPWVGLSGNFGKSVAFSADGETALVGDPEFTDPSEHGLGGAWVFVDVDGSWVQQGGMLEPNDEDDANNENDEQFGVSVALSSDGDAALIGGTGDDGEAGAAWVFARGSNGVWVQQAPKLTGAGSADGWFGASVALSPDGSTALIGAPGESGGVGHAYIFSESNGAWTQVTTLGGAGESNIDGQGVAFGASVALSADGTTAIVGGPTDNNLAGAAWIFSDSGGSWVEQGSKLTGSTTGGATEQDFGFSVALSADGDTAVVGSLVNGAWLFSRSGTTWSADGMQIGGSGEFGYSVALSPDGDTAFVGAPQNGSGGAVTVLSDTSGSWTVGQTLSGTSNESIGSSLSLSGDGSKLLVGAAGSGTAAIYTLSSGSWSTSGTPLTVYISAEAGYNVALSADGNTAVVGAPAFADWQGTAWVFTRSGSTWTQQGGALTPSGENNFVGGAEFGFAVAISGDGTTVLVGAPDDGSLNQGAVFAFSFANGSWFQPGPKLTGFGENNSPVGAGFGFSVALSSDGNTALIGGPYDTDYAGAAWVFTRANGNWTGNGGAITPSDEDNNAGGGQFGESVALSSDGTTAVIGAPFDGPSSSDYAGAAWIFTNSGGGWAQKGAKLTPSDEDNSGGGGLFGESVALSGDGTTALIGGPGDGSASQGAAWLFKAASPDWGQQGSKLTPDDEDNSVAGGEFGFAVSLSSDGSTALIGAPNDDGYAGAAWTYSSSGSAWTQDGAKVTPSDEDNSGGGGQFGFATALSSDGNTGLVGGPTDRSYFAGAAWPLAAAPATVPNAPTGASATAGNRQATVSFTPPTSNGGEAITSYTVTASPGGATTTGASSPITVTGLTNGTSYTFTVTATNGVGTGAASSPSNQVTPEQTTAPGPPTGVSAVAGNSQTTVSFSPPASNGGSAITSYTVTASPGGAQANGSSSPITVTGLTNGTSYTFTVTATNSAGTGPASSASAAVTPSASSSSGGGVSHGGGGGGSDFISVSLSPGSQTVSAGGTASWTVTVTNTGGNYVGDVAVSDGSVPGCNQTSGQSAGLYSMAPTVSVSYTCSTSVAGDLTNTVNASAVGPAGDTVTASASATVTVTGAAYIPPPVAKTPSSHSTSGTSASPGTAVSVALLSLSDLKIVVSGKTATLHLTTKLSAATVLDLVLLNSKGHTLTRWVIHAVKGTTTLTLRLLANARKPGHDKLNITETGNTKPKTLPVTIKA